MTFQEDPNWLSLEQASAFLGVSANTVRSIAGSELLPFKEDEQGKRWFHHNHLAVLKRTQPWRQPLRRQIGWRSVLAGVFLTGVLAVAGIAAWRTLSSALALREARNAMEAHAWEQSLNAVNRVLLANPNNKNALRLAAQASGRMNQFSKTMAYYRQLEQLGGLTPLDRLDFAMIALGRGKTEVTRQQVKAILRNQPDHYLANRLLADLLVKEGEAPAALKRLSQLYLQHPSKVLGWDIRILASVMGAPDPLPMSASPKERTLTLTYNRALHAHKKGDLNGAVKHYEEIIAQRPVLALAMNNMAWHYLQKTNRSRKDLSASFALASQAFLIAPESWAITDTLATVALAYGNAKGALYFSEESLKRHPTDPAVVWYHKALALHGLGRVKDAETAWKKAIALQRTGSGVSPETLLNLGRLFKKKPH